MAYEDGILYSASQDKTVRAWVEEEEHKWKCIKTIEQADIVEVLAVCSGTLYVGKQDKEICLIDTDLLWVYMVDFHFLISLLGT